MKTLQDYKKQLDDVFYSTNFMTRSLPKFRAKLEELKLDIPFNIIDEYYNNQAITQVFKPYEEVHQYHPIIAYYPFERVFIDTMYLTLKHSVLAFVNMMDLFSKFAFSKCYVIPARTSNIPSNNSLNAFKEFLEVIPKHMTVGMVNSDRGSEYKGEFHTFLESKNIIQVYSNTGDHLAQSPIERFNSTLRLMIEKYRTINNNRIDNNSLKQIINAYNNTTHSNSSYTPQEILSNQKYQNQLSGYYTQLNKTYNKVKVQPLTGYVRVLLKPTAFQKIKPVWSVEIYKIKSLNNNFYTLEGSDKVYRREELQPVNKDTVMKKNIHIVDDENEEVEKPVMKTRSKTKVVIEDPKEKRIRKPNQFFL